MTLNKYEEFKQMPIDKLAKLAAGSGTGSNLEMAKLVYGELMLELQHKYAKEQIDLQHKKNTKIMDKQVRWIKFSALLTALATLAAVLLGWYLSELKSSQLHKSDTKKTVHHQNVNSISAPYSIKTIHHDHPKTNI